MNFTALQSDNNVISKQLGGIDYIYGEFWTSRQRQANRIHEVSYRACFKPQLVKYFIDNFSDLGDVVYDPFMGRGTTPIETALNCRIPYGNDINPLCLVLTEPRINPPRLEDIINRLKSINLDKKSVDYPDLLNFYHPKTLQSIEALRNYFFQRKEAKLLDQVDKFIRMIVINRLTGHSSGFLSVYTLPPNQAVSIKSQIKINRKLKQIPPERDLIDIVIKKSKSLLSQTLSQSEQTLFTTEDSHYNSPPRAAQVLLTTEDSRYNSLIQAEEVTLTITSPPFLMEVNYVQDNWLRCWFLGLDSKDIEIDMHNKIEDWQGFIHLTLKELSRITKLGGHIAFEVGEVRKRTINLEEYVINASNGLSLKILGVLVNQQNFTKTSNCWGVQNNNQGTNSNRIVLMQKI